MVVTIIAAITVIILATTAFADAEIPEAMVAEMSVAATREMKAVDVAETDRPDPIVLKDVVVPVLPVLWVLLVLRVPLVLPVLLVRQ